MPPHHTDIIAAIATAPGRGGIGVVRVSGPDLAVLRTRLFAQPLKPRHAHFLPFLRADGSVIDEGIVLSFPGPHSYTGEDVLELQGHGGPAVLRQVLERCLEAGRDLGLRLAEPGEFTRRAFLNDRLDLAQAEAVADLIEASSDAAARGAMASLSGAFSAQVDALAGDIVGLRTLVEATLDFPEEEIDFLEKYQARGTLQQLRETLQTIIAQTRQGVILREGLRVVLAGQPNVGKSSLLNALAGFEAAIVTPIAGTTRDKVEQQIHIDGVPLHIVDTAGLRDTEDTVERIGIARSWQEIEKADVVLHLRDIRSVMELTARSAQNTDTETALNRANAQEASDLSSDSPLPAVGESPILEPNIAARVPAGTPVLTVYNKLDLLPGGTETVACEAQPSPNGRRDAGEILCISAATGQGLDTLRQTLLRLAGWNASMESPWLARERHMQALLRAREHLEMAWEHAQMDDRVLDLFAEELRLAHEALGEITGVFSSDDLLGEIFAGFCIGK